MEEKEEESIGQELQRYFKEHLNKFRDWKKPLATDSFPTKVGKVIVKILAVLLMIAFSPVILIFMIAAFAGAL